MVRLGRGVQDVQAVVSSMRRSTPKATLRSEFLGDIGAGAGHRYCTKYQYQRQAGGARWSDAVGYSNPSGLREYAGFAGISRHKSECADSRPHLPCAEIQRSLSSSSASSKVLSKLSSFDAMKYRLSNTVSSFNGLASPTLAAQGNSA